MGGAAQFRPSYPSSALDKIRSIVRSGAQVLDLAAGTGIMSQLLAAAGYKVIAVEPVDPMREKLKSLYPEIPALKGTSYEIPLPSASQDAVVVAQAFHWFDNLESLREIHRVLKPDGHLLLIWNMESKRRMWVDKIRR